MGYTRPLDSQSVVKKILSSFVFHGHFPTGVSHQGLIFISIFGQFYQKKV